MSRALETKVKKKKRATTIFTTMSVAHVDDEDDDDDKDNDMDTPGQHVEKVFPSGDIYMGQWGQNCPNGHGKCVWSDGCMYVGDWSNGKANGKGKFSWPSGATYEGHFKNGFMEGHGVYTGTSNDTYKGSWLCNTRHDDGVQSYGNGDYYEGQFRLGQLDGKGRYQWRNGNEYMGHWRDGKMHGNGIMVWPNGNSYEGGWANGVPRGNGKFSWDDGSFYVGIWSQDSSKQRGTYYTSSSQIGGFDRDPNDAYLMDLSDCCVASIEKIPVFPCQKMTNMCVEIHETMKQPQLVVRPAKRQGITISKGHKNYELMLNLQLGIRHSVGRCGPATSVDLKASEFDPKDKIWTRFAPQGSKHTPPHHSCEFKWKDYCPLVFRTLRKLFKVDPGDYMLSICGNDALRELSSPGKSGSFFYITSDDKYLIKTMKKSEVKVLLRMLPDYYNHVRSHENTLVTKFFGLHCVKMNGPIQKKVRFVIMGNLFCTQHTIHRRFDLKGSSHGRSSLKHDTDIVDSSTTLKDLDLNFIFRLQSSWFQHFCRQVKQDCEFLEQERIMDYSLLVGIHFRQVSDSGEAILHHGHANDNNNNDNVSEVIEPRLGCNMGARAEVITVRRNNAEQAQYYEVVLVMGIIDILQDYDISKKLEHAYKSLQYDAVSISAVDPAQYSKRFLDFIFRIFRQEDM